MVQRWRPKIRDRPTPGRAGTRRDGERKFARRSNSGHRGADRCSTGDYGDGGKTSCMTSGYGVFLGLDVSKGDHRAVIRTGLGYGCMTGHRRTQAAGVVRQARCPWAAAGRGRSTSHERGAACPGRPRLRAPSWPACRAWPCGASPVSTRATPRPTRPGCGRRRRPRPAPHTAAGRHR